MTERKINYDRGVVIRLINSMNMEVFMYRDEPGVFYSAHGKEVPVALARAAGYDVDRLLVQRQHRERVKIASDKIASELQVGKELGKRIVVQEAEGYRIVSLGLGRHEVEDDEGNSLTPGAALTLELARTVLKDLVPVSAGKGGAGTGTAGAVARSAPAAA